LKISVLIHIVILFLRISCIATLDEKMENKLRKANFNKNINVNIFLKIRQGGKNK
jgi:hypothetical protein